MKFSFPDDTDKKFVVEKVLLLEHICAYAPIKSNHKTLYEIPKVFDWNATETQPKTATD